MCIAVDSVSMTASPTSSRARVAALFVAGVALAWALTIQGEGAVKRPVVAARAQTRAETSPPALPLPPARPLPRPPAPRREPPAVAEPPRTAESELAPGEEESPLPSRPTRAELDAAHALEPEDEAWNTELTDLLQKELAARGFDERALHRVDCRATLCLTRVKLDSRASLMELSSLATKLPGLALSLEIEDHTTARSRRLPRTKQDLRYVEAPKPCGGSAENALHREGGSRLRPRCRLRARVVAGL